MRWLQQLKKAGWFCGVGKGAHEAYQFFLDYDALPMTECSGEGEIRLPGGWRPFTHIHK